MRAVAERIGMSESGFVRGAKRGTLSAENLLALAEAHDEHPAKVLRLAGKDDLAALIERLYGPGLDALTSSQREVLGLWEQIAEERRQPLLYTMRVFAQEAGGSLPGVTREESTSGRTKTPGKWRGARRRHGSTGAAKK